MRIVSIGNPSEYSGMGGGGAVGINVADRVTGLFGMVNVQGLFEGPPAHDAPVVVQPENRQLADGFAVTVTVEPTTTEQPPGPGQFGLTEPAPASTSVKSVATAG